MTETNNIYVMLQEKKYMYTVFTGKTLGLQL